MTAQDSIIRVKAVLDGLRHKQFKSALIAAVFWGLAAAIALLITATFLEQWLALNPPYRVYLSVTITFLSAVVVIVPIIGVLTNIRFRRGRASEEWWALKLGEFLSPGQHDRMLNAYQVATYPPGMREQVSDELAHYALVLALSEMDHHSPDEIIDHLPIKQSLLTLSMTVVALAGVLTISSDRFIDSFNRLLHYNHQFQVQTPFSITAIHPTGWAYRGEPIVFEIKADGAFPTDAEFLYWREEGEPERVKIKLDPTISQFYLAGQSESFYYRLNASRFVGAVNRMKIIARPQIIRLETRLKPPTYTKLPVIVGRENSGDVEALPGSVLSLAVTASKPLMGCTLVILTEGVDSSAIDSINMKIHGERAEIDHHIRNSFNYQIVLTDRDGHNDKDRITYSVHIIRDERPSVRVVFPDTDVEIGDNLQLPLEVEAIDDFGISRVKVSYRLISRDSTIAEFALAPDRPGAETVLARTVWDISLIDLVPGDVIEYWAVAWDNDNINGPKWGESERRLVRLPSIEEIVAQVEQAENESLEETRSILEAARELKEDVQKAMDELKRNPELTWEKQAQMEQVLERQNQLQEKMQQAAQKLDELVNRLDKHDMATAELMEKYRQLQELLQEVATEELKEAMEKLKQAMESQDPDKVQQALEQFDMNRERFLQSIERTMNILRQLQLERRLDELAREAERLVAEQSDILKALDSLKPENMVHREEGLAEAIKALRQKINDTAQMASAQKEAGLSGTLDSLALEIDKNALQNISDAVDKMSLGDSNNSRQAAERVRGDLTRLWSALNRVSQELKEKRKADLARKLRISVEQMLFLSREQEDLADKSSQLGTQSPRFRGLAGRQSDLRVALQDLTGRLFELSRETFFITPDLSAELGRADQAMAKAIDGYTSRTPRSVTSPQLDGLGSLNRTAKRLIEILSELQGSSSSSGYEEMMQKLSEMASAQQGLNQQTMPIPGGTNQSSMPGGAQLAQMAAQQRALQQQMNQLAEKAQGMKEVLGDLEGVAESMGEIAKDMENQRITERTRRLQQQIVTRLLDATKSVRQEQFSRQRESRRGEDIIRSSPDDYQRKLDRDQLRRDLMKALQEGYARDYRNLIRMYFQSLDREPSLSKP